MRLGQLSQPHLLIHQRMVMGQALQPAVAEAIAAAVSHVRDPCPVATGRHGHQGGSHAGTGRILLRAAMHAVVGRVYRLLECFPGQRALAHGMQHGLDRHPAGDFARGRATHAIANHKIAGALRLLEAPAHRSLHCSSGSAPDRTHRLPRIPAFFAACLASASLWSTCNCATIICPEPGVKQVLGFPMAAPGRTPGTSWLNPGLLIDGERRFAGCRWPGRSKKRLNRHAESGKSL